MSEHQVHADSLHRNSGEAEDAENKRTDIEIGEEKLQPESQWHRDHDPGQEGLLVPIRTDTENQIN